MNVLYLHGHCRYKEGWFEQSKNLTKILKSFSSRKSTDRPSVDQLSEKGNLGSNAKNLDSKRIFVTFPSVQVHRYKNPKNAIIGHLNVNSLKNKFIAVEEFLFDIRN